MSIKPRSLSCLFAEHISSRDAIIFATTFIQTRKLFNVCVSFDAHLFFTSPHTTKGGTQAGHCAPRAAHAAPPEALKVTSSGGTSEEIGVPLRDEGARVAASVERKKTKNKRESGSENEACAVNTPE